MKPSPIALIRVHFADLPDPRVERTRTHDLMNILTIGLCAAISGAENGVQVEEYGRANTTARPLLKLDGSRSR